jgi:hypothetical protein
MKIQPIRLLILLNLVALCGVAALWYDQDGVMRNVQWEAPQPVLPQIGQLNVAFQPASASPDPLAHIAILERPLFAPDRRPPPPPPPAVEAAQVDPLAAVELIGLFSGENGGVLARVEGQVRRIKLRESIGAWSLKGIAGREATFVQGDEQRTLSLNYSRLGASAGVVTSKAAPTPAVAAVARVANNLQIESRAFLNRRNGVRANAGLPPLQE